MRRERMRAQTTCNSAGQISHEQVNRILHAEVLRNPNMYLVAANTTPGPNAEQCCHRSRNLANSHIQNNALVVTLGDRGISSVSIV